MLARVGHAPPRYACSDGASGTVVCGRRPPAHCRETGGRCLTRPTVIYLAAGALEVKRNREQGSCQCVEKENVMARKKCRAAATAAHTLTCLRTHCSLCDQPMRVAYWTQRTVTTLQGNCRLMLRIRRCGNPQCAWYHRAYRLAKSPLAIGLACFIAMIMLISHAPTMRWSSIWFGAVS